MATLTCRRTAFHFSKGLPSSSPAVVTVIVRNGGTRPRIQRPAHPSWFRKQILALTKPKFEVRHPTTQNLWKDCPKIKEQEELKLKKLPNVLEVLYGKQLRELCEKNPMIAFFHTNYFKEEKLHTNWQNARRLGMEMKRYNRRVGRSGLEGTKWEECLHFFETSKGEQMMLFSPTVEPKNLLKFDKKSFEFTLIGAVIYDRLLSRSEVIKLANAPPIEHLRGELCSILEYSTQKTISLLNRSTQELSQNLSQYIKDQTK